MEVSERRLEGQAAKGTIEIASKALQDFNTQRGEKT
jgi:hypothetical protein